MDSRIIFGLGVSVLTWFLRYLFPSLPRPVAFTGAAIAAGLIVMSFFPHLRPFPVALMLLGLAAFTGGLALQLTRPAELAGPFANPPTTPDRSTASEDGAAQQTTVIASHPIGATRMSSQTVGVVDHVSNTQGVKKTDASSSARTPTTEQPTDPKPVLKQLTELYILSHDGITSRMMAGLELPPKEFLNQELAKQGADWRVTSVNGGTAHVVHIRSADR